MPTGETAKGVNPLTAGTCRHISDSRRGKRSSRGLGTQCELRRHWNSTRRGKRSDWLDRELNEWLPQLASVGIQFHRQMVATPQCVGAEGVSVDDLRRTEMAAELIYKGPVSRQRIRAGRRGVHEGQAQARPVEGVKGPAPPHVQCGTVPSPHSHDALPGLVRQQNFAVVLSQKGYSFLFRTWPSAGQ
jgi:hypothetical protein